MMLRPMVVVGLSLLSGRVAAASPMEIRFGAPVVPGIAGAAEVEGSFAAASLDGARQWEKEALPIGNGRLGGMLFGGVSSDRMQFNVDSLWTGGENVSGGYDVNEFGCYQSFGDVLITAAGAKKAELICESGHLPYMAKEGIEASTDGKLDKWCVEHKGREVIWRKKWDEAQVVKVYALTSANDEEKRDPRTWKLEGSVDGKAWVVLDEHQDEAPFASRHLKKEYKIAKPAAYAFYRMTFAPAKEVTHFQVAEIELGGVEERAAAPKAYSRSLDLSTAVHTHLPVPSIRRSWYVLRHPSPVVWRASWSCAARMGRRPWRQRGNCAFRENFRINWHTPLRLPPNIVADPW
jgi:hypothetical protein